MSSFGGLTNYQYPGAYPLSMVSCQADLPQIKYSPNMSRAPPDQILTDGLTSWKTGREGVIVLYKSDGKMGPALIFLSLAEQPLKSLVVKIAGFDRVTMFYYLAHFSCFIFFASIASLITGYTQW